MDEKTNDFRHKSEEEVFDMYKKIALKDYIYNEIWDINKNNGEITNHSNIIDKEANNGQ